MLVSGLLPSTVDLRRPNLAVRGGGVGVERIMMGFGKTGMVVECSSRPQKKSTAHHRKSRPEKSQPWDIYRGPTIYPVLPVIPPDWILVAAGQADDDKESEEAAADGDGEVKEVAVEVVSS